MILEGQSAIAMAVTLFACACALFCLAFLTPMDAEERLVATHLLAVLHLLAFCLLLTGLALLTFSS